jgi:hypothetical protein
VLFSCNLEPSDHDFSKTGQPDCKLVCIEPQVTSPTSSPASSRGAADPRTPAEHVILAELHAGADQYITDTLDLYGPSLFQAEIPLRGPQEFLRQLMRGQIATPSKPMRTLGVEDDFCGLPIHRVYAAAESPVSG